MNERCSLDGGYSVTNLAGPHFINATDFETQTVSLTSGTGMVPYHVLSSATLSRFAFYRRTDVGTYPLNGEVTQSAFEIPMGGDIVRAYIS
eukprot:scaffold14482_cov157-Amphora_coffeaeformis.AAC.4